MLKIKRPTPITDVVTTATTSEAPTGTVPTQPATGAQEPPVGLDEVCGVLLQHSISLTAPRMLVRCSGSFMSLSWWPCSAKKISVRQSRSAKTVHHTFSG